MSKTIDDVLDWNIRAVVEATVETNVTGRPIQVTVTQELIDKHKTLAKQALYELLKAEAEEYSAAVVGTVKAVPLDTVAKLLGVTNADQ